MVTIPSTAPEDGSFFQDAMEEVGAEFEEPVVIKRWFAGPADFLDPLYLGSDPIAATYANIYTTANITQVTQQELALGNTFYEIGDLHAEFRIPVFGAETNQGDGNPLVNVTQPGARPADQVVYRGRFYRVVGHVERPFETRTQYYRATLRQLYRNV